LVRRGLVATRQQGVECIEAGRVLVSGSVADKPARLVSPADALVISGPARRFVGRGGEKLDAALGEWGIDVTGLRVLDAGASTGGFTDCLLQRGAATVVAVDVGHGQLAQRLRADRRVEVHERTNIRHATLEDLGGRHFALIVADLSFISLRTVTPALLALAEPDATLIVLVKPQFEAGRREASRGKGVIRDPDTWRSVLVEVGSAMESQGSTMMEVMVSPIHGADGNVEFLARLCAHRGAPAVALAERVAIDRVVTEAAESAGRER
jgi:23S rRNA (cytidine1920-2'-O)/16S rRNA (cytidine1409-2'-O)-methyltransferase